MWVSFGFWEKSLKFIALLFDFFGFTVDFLSNLLKERQITLSNYGSANSQSKCKLQMTKRLAGFVSGAYLRLAHTAAAVFTLVVSRLRGPFQRRRGRDGGGEQ